MADTQKINLPQFFKDTGVGTSVPGNKIQTDNKLLDDSYTMLTAYASGKQEMLPNSFGVMKAGFTVNMKNAGIDVTDPEKIKTYASSIANDVNQKFGPQSPAPHDLQSFDRQIDDVKSDQKNKFVNHKVGRESPLNEYLVERDVISKHGFNASEPKSQMKALSDEIKKLDEIAKGGSDPRITNTGAFKKISEEFAKINGAPADPKEVAQYLKTGTEVAKEGFAKAAHIKNAAANMDISEDKAAKIAEQVKAVMNSSNNVAKFQESTSHVSPPLSGGSGGSIGHTV